MAAGQGFKTFVTGEVLTAGDVNGYLMQGINVFANSTARDAAITAPAEGQFAFTKDNNSLWYYDGAAWVASGATGDIEGVTVTSPLTGGGTSGTVTVGILSGTTSNLGAVQLSDSTSSTSTTLAATANAVKTTYDLANGAIAKSIVDAKGDLIAATAADTVSRLAVGTNGQVLKANSAQATGLEWGSVSATKSYSLLGSSALSGSTTVTISGISNRDEILVTIDNASGSGASQCIMRFNSDTGSNYSQYGANPIFNTTYNQTNATAIKSSTSTTSISFLNTASATDSFGAGYLRLSGGASSGIKTFQMVGYASRNSAGNDPYGYFTGGIWNNSATVTSVSFIAEFGGNFDAGTIRVWGSA